MLLRKISHLFLLVVSLVFITMPSAYAYLDPGTGSMILQATIAAIALGLATIRSWWYRLADLFGSKSNNKNENPESLENNEPTESKEQHE